MTGEGVIRFLACFGEKVYEPRQGWFNCSCLFAPWTHEGGKDNHPSFGILRNDLGESYYKCWSCGEHGTVSDLVFKLLRLNRAAPKRQYDFKTALQLVAYDNSTCEAVYNPVDYEDEVAVPTDYIFPESWLKSFFPARKNPYLLSRGIPEAVINKLDVRIDPLGNRVCFPFRNFAGDLIGLQGRACGSEGLRWQLYKHHGKCNRQVWGNESNISFEKPLVLTEGFTDLAKILGVYSNVVCSLTSSLTREKAARVADAKQIITFYDYGTGGGHARDFVDRYYVEADKVHIIPTAKQGDAGNLSMKEEIGRAHV